MLYRTDLTQRAFFTNSIYSIFMIDCTTPTISCCHMLWRRGEALACHVAIRSLPISFQSIWTFGFRWRWTIWNLNLKKVKGGPVHLSHNLLIRFFSSHHKWSVGWVDRLIPDSIIYNNYRELDWLLSLNRLYLRIVLQWYIKKDLQKKKRCLFVLLTERVRVILPDQTPVQKDIKFSIFWFGYVFG